METLVQGFGRPWKTRPYHGAWTAWLDAPCSVERSPLADSRGTTQVLLSARVARGRVLQLRLAFERPTPLIEK